MEKVIDMQSPTDKGKGGEKCLQKIQYRKSYKAIPGFWAILYLRQCPYAQDLQKDIENMIPSYWMGDQVFFPKHLTNRKEMIDLWVEKYHLTNLSYDSSAWKLFFKEVQTHFRQGRVDVAAVALRYIYKYNPYFLKKYKRFYIFEDIAYYYESKGDLIKSLKHLKAQALLQPESSEAYLNMSSFLILNGLSEEAIGICKDGLKINPQDQYLSNNLLAAYLNEGYFDIAMDYLNERILENSRISMNWKLKGDILYELEHYDEAARCYQKALWIRSKELEDIKTDIFYGLAICYQHLGQIRKAIRYNKQLLKCDESDAAALLNLSKLYGEDLKQYTTAQKYAEHLVRLHPENGYGHHNLGLIYLYTRRFDKAKWHLYRARKLVPNYQPIYDAIEELNRLND